MNALIEHEDLKEFILGEKLGFGLNRTVYAYKLSPDYVLKCALEYPNINVLEEEVWQMVRDTDIAKWFAPCMQISQCGMYLLQKRVEQRPKSEYPKLIPSFFGDLKYKNFGWIDDQFVCCDYAGFVCTSMSHKWSGRLKKAEWWESV